MYLMRGYKDISFRQYFVYKYQDGNTAISYLIMAQMINYRIVILASLEVKVVGN